MKMQEELRVGAEAFFNEIVCSVLLAIQKQTEKKIHKCQLKTEVNHGKKLKGRSSKNAGTTVKIVKYELNRHYEASFLSTVDTAAVKYEITVSNEEHGSFLYEEQHALLHQKGIKICRLLNSGYIERKEEQKGRQWLKHTEGYLLIEKNV